MAKQFLGALKMPETDKSIADMTDDEIDELVASMGDPIGDAMEAAGLIPPRGPEPSGSDKR
jgi:hypothetical protein